MSLIKYVTFSLGREGVKGNSDNVTEYDVFFFWKSSLILPGEDPKRYPTKEEADEMRMKEEETGMDLRLGAKTPEQREDEAIDCRSPRK